MKVLGLAGAGLGTAAAAAPVFHDLDEVIASPQANWKRPWYVKEVDQPTLELDWAQIKRYSENDNMRGSHRAEYMDTYLPREEQDARSALKKEKEAEWLTAGRPGYNVRDNALSGSAGKGSVGWDFLGPQRTSPATPWQGTPEENARMLRAAMRLFGAMTVGYMQLDAQTENVVFSRERGDKISNVFRDVDKAEIRDTGGGFTEHVIPNKARWVILYSDQESQELWKRNPTNMTIQVRYGRGQNIQQRVQEFTQRLGYQTLGAFSTNALVIAPFAGAMCGVGEIGRTNRILTPEYGPTVGVFGLITDLPLAPTKPVDAGLFRFCHTCKKCAEACGEGALSFDDEPTWDVSGPWNNPGHNTFFEDSRKCRTWKLLPEACKAGRCFASCTFTKYHESNIHQLVQGTLATVPTFNGFFRTMDDAFGYGLRGRRHDDFDTGPREVVDAAQEDWWNLNLPIMGVDSTVGAQRGIS
jgi:reductive dehalogenase